MKKVIFFFAFFLILQTASAKSYRIGDKINNEIEFYKKYKFELPPGNWTVADRYINHYYGFKSKGYILLKINNKKVEEFLSIGEQVIPSKWVADINPVINDIVFKNKYDGCYERPEYYTLKYFRKGSTFNCFWVYHLDTYKELFDPDDPELRGIYSQFKAWLRDNNIALPKVTVGSSHWYFSRLSGGKWFSIQHLIDPEIFGGPKTTFVDEIRSEYHKNNISNYPKHQSFMENILAIRAIRHQQFEIEVKAKDHHKLNLKSYISNTSDLNNNSGNSNVLSQLNKLKDLLNSGILTQEEFKKAKGKILN